MKGIRSMADWFEMWFLWLVVTASSWCVGLVLAVIVAHGAGRALPSPLSLVIGGIMAGALIGLAQWAILSPNVRGAGWWVLATAMGWMAGLMITGFVVSAKENVLVRFVGVGLGGFVFGLAQWAALRPGSGRRGKWVLATTAGWVAALVLGIGLPGTVDVDVTGSGAMEAALTGAVGLALIGLVAMVALPTLYPKPGKATSDKYVRWWP
jgi:hypothetical protein